MLQNCATSCERIADQALQDAKELEGIDSFFNLSAKDINGNVVQFSNFRGDVTIIVNGKETYLTFLLDASIFLFNSNFIWANTKAFVNRAARLP